MMAILEPAILTLISWLIPSIIAAIGITLSAELIDRDMDFVQILKMAIYANSLPAVASLFLSKYLIRIPYGFELLGFLCWIGLALVMLSDTETVNRIKIAVIGFLITSVLWYLLPWLSF